MSSVSGGSRPADDVTDQDIELEIADFEAKLAESKKRLQARRRHPAGENGSSPHEPRLPLLEKPTAASPSSASHFLFLLSDSALPLGSFAFSSGLESYLAHQPRRRTGGSSGPAVGPPPPSFTSRFLPLSISSYASTTLPFVLAAHRDPAAVAELDDALDAAIICTVGRRASTAQGRALLSIWERSFAGAVPPEAAQALRPFSALLRTSASAAGSGSGSGSGSSSGGVCEAGEAAIPPVAAHLAPLFGAVANLAGLSRHQTAYVFMLGHVKALISAAVRASLFGPYQAQKVLASAQVRDLIRAAIGREWDTPFEEAGQSVPVMDLWIGRHEVLYSRIFNS